MKLVHGIQELQTEGGSVLSIGNFDGVHIGHQMILSVLSSHAARLSCPSVVMTFEPHPAALLKPERQPPRLTTPIRKAELIAESGVDFVLEYPTDWALLKLTPREFFDQLVVTGLQATGLVEGPNFFFGKDRSGDGTTLRQFCQETGRFLEIVSPTLLDGQIVSSSAIRRALQAADVTLAARMLGRNYSVHGTVVTGAQRGRTIGFPTANLGRVETLLPADGVYAARVHVRGQTFVAAVNIGPNPTFSEDERKVEAHLLDASVDLYGAEMQLEFVRHIRPARRFDSVEDLQAQIAKDVTVIRGSLDEACGDQVG